MPTVGGMFKRILILVAGVVLGFGLALGAGRLALAWGWWPSRDLSRSMDFVRDVVKLVNENYVDASAVSYDSLSKTAVHGLVESLDAHSEYLEAKDYAQLQEDLSGDFTGIGIQVELRNGRARVIAPIANSPAERAGVQRGDEIQSIDGRPLEKDFTLSSITERLRGRPGTSVLVGFLRPSTQQSLTFALTREKIQLQSVRAPQLLSGGVGYVQITEFSDHTADDFHDAIDSLLEQGMQALVLDLRNNPGGLLEAAVEVAEPFFSRGELIVSTQGRTPRDREEYLSETRGPPLRLPIAILINGSTASAAEVVTGALKDTGRAIVIGEKSFGKGSVQSIFDLPGKQGLRLTTARYYTPSGTSIHAKGIEPQVELILSPEEDSKIRVQQTRADITDPVEFKERFGFTPIPDRQLQAALDVLTGIRILETRKVAAGPRRSIQ
ncbi:MAG: S41 family peptidase [Opitutus sp.]|nr:S41 family peptidase [Opitutus sp.]